MLNTAPPTVGGFGRYHNWVPPTVGRYGGLVTVTGGPLLAFVDRNVTGGPLPLHTYRYRCAVTVTVSLLRRHCSAVTVTPAATALP